MHKTYKVSLQDKSTADVYKEGSSSGDDGEGSASAAFETVEAASYLPRVDFPTPVFSFVSTFSG